MQIGGEYTILTDDGETLAGGLCSACPYQTTAPEPEMCMCTLQYDPQCGVDGVTYGNTCAAGCDDVEIAYAGECQFGEPGVCNR